MKYKKEILVEDKQKLLGQKAQKLPIEVRQDPILEATQAKLHKIYAIENHLKKNKKNHTLSIYFFSIFLIGCFSFLHFFVYWDTNKDSTEFFKDDRLKELYLQKKGYISKKILLKKENQNLKKEKESFLKKLRIEYNKNIREIKKNYTTFKLQASFIRKATKAFQNDSKKNREEYNRQLIRKKSELKNIEKELQNNLKKFAKRQKALESVTNSQFYLERIAKNFLNKIKYYKMQEELKNNNLSEKLKKK